MLSSQEAEELIYLGRQAVRSFLRGESFKVSQDLKARFSIKKGLFTTLLTFPDKQLRGCVGVPSPVYPLWYGIVLTSLSSALKDPRFPPLRIEEVDSVLWEISLLGKVKRVSRKSLPGNLNVGREGLIVERENRTGLLLPQVAIRNRWNAEEFLEHTCLKAGLPKNCWRDSNTKVYKFTADIFEEVEPWGPVKKMDMNLR